MQCPVILCLCVFLQPWRHNDDIKRWIHLGKMHGPPLDLKWYRKCVKSFTRITHTSETINKLRKFTWWGNRSVPQRLNLPSLCYPVSVYIPSFEPSFIALFALYTQSKLCLLFWICLTVLVKTWMATGSWSALFGVTLFFNTISDCLLFKCLYV